MKIFVFDDKYWEKISTWLHKLIHDEDIIFPILKNVTNPINYIKDIKEDDIILLDNWFIQNNWYEEEYWEYFLEELFKKWLKNVIISISDNSKEMLWWFFYWSFLTKKMTN